MTKPLKLPDIELLDDYSTSPPASLRDTFPSNPPPRDTTTPILIHRLKMLIRKHIKIGIEKIVKKRALKILSEDAITYMRDSLPPIKAKNCQSSFISAKK
jgi:hypothetical protein